MGWRFRKRINLGGGFRLNLGKKSAGVSFGVRGARMSINSKGRRTTTVGIPGTGLYYQSSSSLGHVQRKPKRRLGCFSLIGWFFIFGVVYAVAASAIRFIRQHWAPSIVVAAMLLIVAIVVWRAMRTEHETLRELHEDGTSSVPTGASPSSHAHFDMNVKATSVTDHYFKMLSKIETCKSRGDYQQMLHLCLQSVQLVPTLVAETVNEYGRWDISSIPCIEYAGKYLVVLMDKQHLQEILDQLYPVPELRPWIDITEDAVKEIDIVRSLYKWITKHPGFIQNKLGKALGIDGRVIANMCHYAEQLGTISRVREGNSYKVYTVPQLDE